MEKKFKAYYPGREEKLVEFSFKQGLEIANKLRGDEFKEVMEYEKIMNYIGIEDKNGTSIYEGDILKINLVKDDIIMDIFLYSYVSDGNACRHLEGNDDLFNNIGDYFNNVNILRVEDAMYEYHNQVENFEVVGNIYTDREKFNF